MVFVKKWRFFNPYFLCKMEQEIVFFEGSERKEAFLDQKKSAQKTTKICIYFKVVSAWFLSKNGDSLIFSFYAKWIKEKCFLKARKEKKPF